MKKYSYSHIILQIGGIKLNKLQSYVQNFYTYLKTNGRLKHRNILGSVFFDRMVGASHTTCRMALEKALKEDLMTLNPAIG